MFHWWHRVRDGTLARSSFPKYVGPLRHAVHEQLERGAECSCKKTAGTCRKLLKQESAIGPPTTRNSRRPAPGEEFLGIFSQSADFLGEGRPFIGLTSPGRPFRLTATPLGRVRRGLALERLPSKMPPSADVAGDLVVN